MTTTENAIDLTTSEQFSGPSGISVGDCGERQFDLMPI